MFKFVVLPCFDLRRSNGSHSYMNNHIYSTLFKTQERESDEEAKK